jgi:uncharacterized protein
MNRWLAWVGYCSILLLAYHVSDSVSGFLLLGAGLVVLFDRYLARRWSSCQRPWGPEIVVRGGSFLLGAVTFFFSRPGIVPLGEAVYRGCMVCLLVAILEPVGHRIAPRWRWVLAASLVVLIPWSVALHPLHTVPKRTPAALGLTFEDVRFASSDGTRLAAWLIPHAAARGNVIYCHGHGRNRGQGAALFTMLHELGLNILAFDFRGHGDSEGHTSTFGDREVEDLLAAVHYCRARFPDQPLFLTGISLGSAVTLQALSRIPDVRGVWSEAAFSSFATTVEHQFTLLPGPLRQTLVEGYYVLGWLDCGFWAPSINPIERLDGLQVPIFFCHGEKDRLVPCSRGRELYDAYAGPKCSWWVAGASHANIRQRNPLEYRRRLRDFIESCLPSAP